MSRRTGWEVGREAKAVLKSREEASQGNKHAEHGEYQRIGKETDGKGTEMGSQEFTGD